MIETEIEEMLKDITDIRAVPNAVCKKILEEIRKHSYYENTYEESEVIKVEEVFKIIRDLGIEV